MPTRRALRERVDEPPDAVGGIVPLEPVLVLDPAPPEELPIPRPFAVDPGRRVALAWVDESSVAGAPGPVSDLSAATTPYVTVGGDLLSDAPRRSPLRPGVVVPTLMIAALAGIYSATTLLWPLNAVTPTITPLHVQPPAAAAATPVWPATGSAAVSVKGIPGGAVSTADASSMASITKLVTALVVLDQMPLAVGEQGPAFQFGAADRAHYWSTLAHG